MCQIVKSGTVRWKRRQRGTRRRIANLILVKLTVLIFLFALLLECDNDKADEDVNHEEGDDDDVDEVEDGDRWAVVGHRTVILGEWVDASMHHSTIDK